jgi:FKBP-type peptidyl-prolyl cis-trans isomerase SlpA
MSDGGPKITPGSKVCMHFALSLPDGTEVVSSFDTDPVTFIMGDGTLSEGLELALYGLRPEARQTLRIDGSMVYGPRDEGNIHEVPLARFPHDIHPAPGFIVAFATPDGGELAGTVLDLDGSNARVDFNHPLAGREIVFQVHVLSVTPPEQGAE